MTLTQICDMWSVGPEHGLLPAEPARLGELAASDPLARADEMCRALAHTSPSDLRAAIESLTSPTKLGTLTPGAAEAALRAYALLATRLIHSDRNGRDRRLPRAIAQPLLQLSRAAGRPPGLTYASYVLTNCSQPPLPRSQPDDIIVAHTFSGTSDEAWFIAVHLAVETIGGEVVRAIADCRSALDAGSIGALVSGIDALAGAIGWSATVLDRIGEHVDADVFRDVVRPNLHGFSNVMFETNPPVRVSYIGETGAQSAMVHAVDLVLAVRHPEVIERSLARFRECAPPQHREYTAFAAAVGREIASLAPSNAGLRQAYVGALRELQSFRDRHVGIVEHYLFAGTRGTGGTSGHPWLRSIRDDVARTAAALA
jgi:indoleamine 2,3-dioxygenase